MCPSSRCQWPPCSVATRACTHTKHHEVSRDDHSTSARAQRNSRPVVSRVTANEIYNLVPRRRHLLSERGRCRGAALRARRAPPPPHQFFGSGGGGWWQDGGGGSEIGVVVCGSLQCCQSVLARLRPEEQAKSDTCVRTVTTSSSRPRSVREKWRKARKQPMRRQSREKSSMGGMRMLGGGAAAQGSS